MNVSHLVVDSLGQLKEDFCYGDGGGRNSYLLFWWWKSYTHEGGGFAPVLAGAERHRSSIPAELA
jgi:hypothetical protein